LREIRCAARSARGRRDRGQPLFALDDTIGPTPVEAGRAMLPRRPRDHGMLCGHVDLHAATAPAGTATVAPRPRACLSNDVLEAREGSVPTGDGGAVISAAHPLHRGILCQAARPGVELANGVHRSVGGGVVREPGGAVASGDSMTPVRARRP